MTNLRTHTTLLPTYFTATFSGPFRSHLSNLLYCVDLLILRALVGRALDIKRFGELIHPKNIRIGIDGPICQTNLATIGTLVGKTVYKTLENLFNVGTDGSNVGFS